MNININHIYFNFVFVLFMYSWLLLSRVYRPHHLQLCYLLFISCFFNISIIRFIMSSFPHWYNSIFHTLHAPRTTWRIHNPRAQPRPPRASLLRLCRSYCGCPRCGAAPIRRCLYRDCFLDLRLFNSPDLRRLVLCYCCQAWTLETVLGGNTALPRWWTARSIDADAKR